MQFDAPIPGQSLTLPPKNYAWERPPEITDPELAIQYHLEKLSRPETVEAVLTYIEALEVDISTFTKGYLRMHVAEGIHSIDVSLVIAPIIHEFIKQVATVAGVDVDDGFEDKTQKERMETKRRELAAKRELKKLGFKPKEIVKNMPEEVEETKEEPASRGLMSREEI